MKLIVAATALAALLSFPVQAQSVRCLNILMGIKVLSEKYGETVIDQRKTTESFGEVTWMFWANPKTNSWTITGILSGEPRMCAFRSGRDYHDVDFDVMVKEIRKGLAGTGA